MAIRIRELEDRLRGLLEDQKDRAEPGDWKEGRRTVLICFDKNTCVKAEEEAGEVASEPLLEDRADAPNGPPHTWTRHQIRNQVGGNAWLDAILDLGAIQVQRSVYILCTNDTAQQVFAKLKPYFSGQNDSLVVTRIQRLARTHAEAAAAENVHNEVAIRLWA